MDTGRFKVIDPGQLVRDERRRADAESAAQERERRTQTGGRKSVAESGARTVGSPARRSGRAQAGAREGAAISNRAGRVQGANRTAESAQASQPAQASRDANRTLTRNREAGAAHANANARRRPPVMLVVLAAALIVVVVAAAQLCSSATPINVTVNGSPHTLRGAKTLQTAIKESGLPLNSGDLISLQGNVLARHEGNPFAATVNGQETTDADFQLHDGDEVTLADGTDIVEDFTAVEEPVPFDVAFRGAGILHTFEQGTPGVKEIRTGALSGEVVEKQTVEPQDLVETRTDIGVGNDKVIALTFDDGPSTSYTEEILDILQENGAKATFFCVGTAVEGAGGDLVRRESEMGCQVCTHSYNDAFSAGGDFALLSPDEQVQEVQRGFQVLAEALGYEPSHYVRLGNEEITAPVIENVSSLIDAEIGWTLDTGDWVYTPEDDVYDVLMSAKPGDVIRMHDGGDHQDVTADALKRALPKLKDKGYSFVTIDELVAYAS